jgi:signal transduction histidine kinase
VTNFLSRWGIRPAFGACPADPFPSLIAMRFGLVLAYWGFLLEGGAGEWRPLSIVVAAYLTVSMTVTNALFWRARRDPNRLIGIWAWVIPSDIVTQAVCYLPIHAVFSPIPLLSIITITTASSIFSGRTTMLSGCAAGLTLLVVGIVQDRSELDGEAVAATFTAILLVLVAAIAANRATGQEQVRQRLDAAEKRGRAQQAALVHALEAARVAESRFLAFSRHAPAALVLFDSNGTPTFVSSYVENTFGLRAEHLALPEVLAQRLSQEDLQTVTGAITGALNGDAATIEVTLLDREGQGCRLVGVIFPVEDGAGAIMRDVTEERLLAAQLTRAQQLETVGTLAGGIAHDFNNLLTTILGNIYLADSLIPEGSEARVCLDDARVAGERGAELVRRLVTYSRPGMEELAPVPLARLIEETVQLASRGLTPQVEVAVEKIDPCAFVMGNFAALQQVLMNLMINARDAMPRGGRLTVACVPVNLQRRNVVGMASELAPGSYHMIIVTDTGSGMSETTIARIFDPFYTTKEVGKGSGLGLSTALGIVHGHAGELGVTSAVGVGSTFRVLLPIAPAEVVEELRVAVA